MEYVLSQNISTMGNLPIPVFNLDDYFTVNEGYNGKDTTDGDIKIDYYFMNADCSIKSERADELKKKMAICLYDEENYINVRIPTNSDAVKYILGWKWGHQTFVVSNVNEKSINASGAGYGRWLYSSGSNPENIAKICLMYHDSPNGKRYYYFVPLFYDNTFPIGVFYLTCWDDFASIDIQEKSEEYGDYSGSGGYGGGSFDDSSDAFGLPSLPSLGVSEVGFINVYNPSKGQLQGFADELFPDFELPEPSTATGIEAVAENLAKTFSVIGDFAESFVNAGLVNYVIDCHIVPVAPTKSAGTGIKVGFKTFDYNPARVTSDYVEFNCGSLEIPEYYQNYLDYEGTRAKLYLPFVGFVDVKPEWFQAGRLGVIYHFNVIDGSCIAFVIATSSKSKLRETVVATFGGNCCVHMPITGVNYASMISGVVGGIAGVASVGSQIVSANQNDKATFQSNIEGTGAVASNFASALGSRPTLEQSNGYNAGMSFMCYRRPYMLIERPVASFSKAYPSEQGLPLNVTKKLSSVRGFTTCENVNLDGFTCTEEEKNMLREALREGCIF